MGKPNYYAIIPANVRYAEDLSEFQKLLYGEITALTDKNWYCFASNDYFANLYKKSKHWISKSINEMSKKWYIDIKIEWFSSRKIYLWNIKKTTAKAVSQPVAENYKTPEEKYKPPLHKNTTPPSRKVQHINTSISIQDYQDNNNSNELLQKSEEFWNSDINILLKFLYQSVWIDSFKETQKLERQYGKHIVNWVKKNGKQEFLRRLEWILSDDFKSRNCNSIRYLYNEIKSYIHSPVVSTKQKDATSITQVNI